MCVCASKFVNCEFSFTEALIKDHTVSSRHHHPARVSLYITAQAPQGNNTFLFPQGDISHHFISSRLTCGAETCLGYCYTCRASSIKAVFNSKLTANITIADVAVAVNNTVALLTLLILYHIYYSNLKQQ